MHMSVILICLHSYYSLFEEFLHVFSTKVWLISLILYIFSLRPSTTFRSFKKTFTLLVVIFSSEKAHLSLNNL